MILTKGDWLGTGSLLIDGASLGVDVEVALSVTEDDAGVTLEGDISGEHQGRISIRIAPDEVGTYIIDARVAGLALDGRGKLESEPHLVLLWNEAQTQGASTTLFRTGNGVGCRGFWQEGGRSYTWEILFKLKQQVVGGGNVVSLANRRRF